MFEEPVHLAGRNPLPALSGNLVQGWKYLLYTFAVRRRNKQNRRVAQKFECIAKALLVSSPVRRTLALLDSRRAALAHSFLFAAHDQVPLVDHNNDRSPALVRIAGDGGIERADAFGRVNHDQ